MGFLLILLVGCCGTKFLASSAETYTKDSASYIEKIRPVLVDIPADTNIIRIRLMDVEGKIKAVEASSHSRRGNLQVMSDEQGNMMARCICDSLLLEVEARDRIIKNYSTKVVTLAGKEVRYTAWYDKISRIFAVLFILIVVFQIYKTIR